VVSVVKCDTVVGGRPACDRDGSPSTPGCGWMVEITHAGNVITRYCHLVRHPDVRVGGQVTAGDPIGQVGATGHVSGPHLHFEVHLNGDRYATGAVDPVKFMRDQGAPLGLAK
jgi:murein DD-endopeptidase MepM/ murein hydrolase activator NlpD